MICAVAPSPLAAQVPASATDTLDWLEAACLGNYLPPEVQWEMDRAAASYADDAVAEQHLQRAFQLAPDHPAVHIGLYRFYFYKNRLQEALLVAQRCLQKAARDNALPQDWRQVTAQSADFSTYAALPRFYLFTLKACVYLHMRLGGMDIAQAMLAKLAELDPLDRMGGSVLAGVMQRMGEEDDG